jgi:hypothetical protein
MASPDAVDRVLRARCCPQREVLVHVAGHDRADAVVDHELGRARARAHAGTVSIEL